VALEGRLPSRGPPGMGKDQAAGPELNRLGTPLGLEKVGSQFLSHRHYTAYASVRRAATRR